MFSLTTRELIILFDINQTENVALGFSLVSSLANAFLCHHQPMVKKSFPKI